jgi:hypothetical protein
MCEMIDSEADKKNIGLLRNLWRLRQSLDIYCVITTHADAISKQGPGKKFFGFLQAACVQLMVLDICKVFEEEKTRKPNSYELNSIDGVLKSLDGAKPSVLDSAKVESFVRKYGNVQSESGTLAALSQVVTEFRKKHKDDLERLKTLQDKWAAHSEFGFALCDPPLDVVMEAMFAFGSDFYEAVSRAFVGSGPVDLNADRAIRAGLRQLLAEHGIQDIE